MKQFKIQFLIGVTLLLLAGGCNDRVSIPTEPRCVNGSLDLTGWRFASRAPINLNGEWDFYWGQLLTPSELATGDSAVRRTRVTIPGAWNGVALGDGTLKGEGFATLQLTIKLHDPDEVLAVKVLDIHTSWRMWIDNTEIGHAGRVADTAESFLPGFAPGVYSFQPRQETIRLTLQVANFALPRGGPLTLIQLGTAAQLHRFRQQRVGLDLFLAGVLAIMALYHCSLFLLRSKDRSTLWFAIFCALIGVRAIITGERLHFSDLPGWEIAYKIDLLSFYLAVPAFCLFVKCLYPQELISAVVRFSQWWAAAITLLVAVTPAMVHVKVLLPYQLVTAGLAIYSFSVFIQAVRHNRTGARWALGGYVVFFVTFINDVLMGNNLIQTGYYVPFGVFFFILSQSALISIRFSTAFDKAERLSFELQNSNQRLKTEIRTRLAAEQRIKADEQRLLRFLDALPVGVFILSRDGSSEYANTEATRILGPEYRPGHHLPELRRHYEAYKTGTNTVYPPEEAPIYKALAGESTYVDDMEIRRAEEVFPIEVWGTPIRDEAGEVAYAIAVFQNIAQRKNTERQLRRYQDNLEEMVTERTAAMAEINEALREANRELKSKESQLVQTAKLASIGELATGVAHELNQPLGYIRLASQLLVRRGPANLDPADVHAKLEKIEQSTGRMVEIINHLRYFGRQAESDRKPCDINAVIENSLTLLKQQFKLNGISVVKAYAPDLPPVTGNAQQLEQVFINLITNARDALTERPQAELRIRSALAAEPAGAGQIEVNVEDNGYGIEPEAIDRIFDPFYTTKEVGKGTGLGLSISYGIIENHGGKIRAASVPGKGTTFTLKLPAAATESASTGPNHAI